ncbi:hypothetical protein AVEN_109527-1 [Araneus ventricosus]|uniref:Uncharacterized protein n=1 Tax=Araneus ventricosus TaxID=182803 RepID=A0A4Y2TWM2_ARAVE|nr:hypothetical protein AVEN_109527-1 [Araneus ventricosus]
MLCYQSCSDDACLMLICPLYLKHLMLSVELMRNKAISSFRAPESPLPEFASGCMWPFDTYCFGATPEDNRSDRRALIAAEKRSRVTPTPSATEKRITPRCSALVPNMTHMWMKCEPVACRRKLLVDGQSI